MADEPVALNIDEREERLLEAVVLMVDRYLGRPKLGLVDGDAMSAGEHAIDSLVEYDLLELTSRTYAIGRWTEAGEQFRKAASDKHMDEGFRANLPQLPHAANERPLDVDEREGTLLMVLLRMVGQYGPVPGVAITSLTEYGFLEPVGSGSYAGQWTEAASAFWTYAWSAEERRNQERIKKFRESRKE